MKDKNVIIAGALFIGLIIVYFILASIRNAAIDKSKVQKLNDLNTYLTIEEVINSSNSDELTETEYVIKDAYYLKDGLVYAYFLNGYSITTNFGSEPEYNDNINYIFKIDGITYMYEPIETSDVYEYAKEYNTENIAFESENILPSSEYTEKNKLEFQISRFLDLISANKDEAYNMLSDNEKETFASPEDLYSQKDSLLNIVSPNVKEFSVEKKRKKNIYDITDINDTNIKIYETDIMNYTIEFN